jgi:hypothetical protein
MKKFIAMLLLSGLAGSLPAQTAGADDKSSMPDLNFPAVTSGEEAIRILGTNVSAVAKAHGKQADELVSTLRRDHALKLDRKGRLFYADNHLPAPQQAATANAEPAASATYPLTNTFKLHSLPGATKKLYLDFDGFVMTGTAWNASSGVSTIYCPPFDADGDPSTFSDSEKTTIQNIWKRVAEDYAPFNVDVTTEDPGVAGITRSSSSDLSYGMRVLISPISQYFGYYGGIAYVGVFNSVGNNYYKPALVFPENLGAEKYIAEAISHEAGHTLGLNHDGTTTGAEYYTGQGSGVTGWAPIMGVGYYQNVVQWSKGEYPNANNTQDDLAVIANYLGYRPDDHGNTLSTATALPISSQLSASGVISSRTDVDVFSFQSAAGTINLNVSPDSTAPNLDILVELLDSSGAVIASDNPPASLGATISVSVPAGKYYLRIDGVGFGTTADGYSDYASVGQYTISGTVPQPVADNQIVTTDEDTAATVTLTGSVPNGGVLSYTVLTAPAHGTLSGIAPNLTYTPTANYSGGDSFTFRTSDGSLNSATATVSIMVNAVNDAPLANSQSVNTSKNIARPITLTGSDVDGGALTFTVAGSPVNGTLSGTAPNLTYTPNLGFFGNDSFTFQVNDGLTDSALATVSITVFEGPEPLPAGWTSQDVGAVGLAGAASYTSATGVYAVSASGTGFSTDQFRYAWQTLSGDGEIKLRITGFNATTNIAQAGVMIRETTAAGSKAYFVGWRNDGQVSYTRRSNTGGSVNTGTSGSVALPYWVRLERVGSTLTSYKSANGVSWTKINSSSITMASQITIGLAVTSGSNSATATATFDNVTVVP